MKVKDLIAKLSEFDPDLEVFAPVHTEFGDFTAELQVGTETNDGETVVTVEGLE